MKKLLTICVLVLALVGVAVAEAPAPFQKAKEYAMSMPEYTWKFNRESDGILANYVLMYDPDNQAILIAREPYVCGYLEKTKEIKCAVWIGMGFMAMDVTEEQALDFSFSVFRDLVSAGAL